MSCAEQMLQEVLAAYDFGAPVVGAIRYGCGHINDTFCVHTQPEDDCCKCFILQRMSAAAFKNPQQNLDRCRTQFKLVRDMEEQFNQMKAVLQKYTTGQI